MEEFSFLLLHFLSYCLFPVPLKDSNELSKKDLWTLEEGMGRHALPCRQRGIRVGTPERAVFEQFSSPVP